MNKKEWEKKQEEKEEIESNRILFKDIKIGLQKDSDLFFEYVVNRLFLALGNYNSIVYEMKLDEKRGFMPERMAPGNKRDCFVSYENLDLVIEPTMRPIYGSADHFSHLDTNPDKKQLGIVMVLDITKIDGALWDMFKEYCDNNNKLFMLCEADFIFKLLENKTTAFSKFEDFLKKSEKIWKECADWKTIKDKIIGLMKDIS